MWWDLFSLAKPHWRTLTLVMLLAACATVAELVEPLIYREAVNDVAGLFVPTEPEETPSIADFQMDPRLRGDDGTAGGVARVAAPQSPVPHPTHRRLRRLPTRRPEGKRTRRTAPKEAHRRGHVAPRTAQETVATLLWAVAALFITAIVARAFVRAADNLSERVANGVEADLILRTFGHVLRQPLGFFGQRPSGGLARQIDQSDQAAPVLSAFTKELAPEAMRLVGIFAIMITQSVHMTLVALATLPVYLLVAWRAARRLETDLPEYYEQWEELSARIQDALSAIKTVKLAGAEDREVARVRDAASSAYTRYLDRNRAANTYVFWQSFLSELGKALVLAYGGWRVFNHMLTPGDVVMFVAYLDRIYDPIDSLTTLQRTFQTHAASLRRAFRLLDLQTNEPSGMPLQPGPGAVEVRDLHFGYTPDRDVLHGISFVARAGDVTAIVGPSGAGKTTIVDLLLRLYTPRSGQISIDAQDIACTAPASIRREVCVVAADGAVFRGTIEQNLRYFRPDATDAEVRRAAAAAGLSRTIERLPQGLATPVGERGVGLSVGERQRLQIGRVLLADPRILVLDEATANLDYATECEVRDALAQMRKGRTTLVISHRYAMVRDADHVLVLDAGRIVEQGRPADLLATGGWFARFAAGSTERTPVSEFSVSEANADIGDDSADEDGVDHHL